MRVDQNKSPRVRGFIQALGICVLYYAATRLGEYLALDSSLVSPVWPPTGVAFAVILRYGYRFSWLIFAAALISANWSNIYPLLPVISAAIRTVEATGCVWLIRSFVADSDPFKTPSGILAYCSISLLVIFFSTTFEVGLRLFVRPIEHLDFASFWATWYLGNYTGALVIAPMLYTWLCPREHRIPSSGIAEFATVILLTLGSTLLIFGGWFTALSDNYSVDFLLLPLLIYIAYRFRVIGSTAGVALVSLVAIWGTANGHGPFLEESNTESQLLLQTFALVIAVTLLVFSTVLIEQDRLTHLLTTSERRYRHFVSNSTEGIWRIRLDKPMPVKMSTINQVDWIFRYARFAEANNAYAGKWGIGEGEKLVGKKFEDLCPAGDTENRDAVKHFIDSGYRVQNLETNGVGIDGRKRHFSTQLSAIVDHGHLTHIWGIVTDITAKKLLRRSREKNRRQEMQLIQANKMGALGTLVSGVAHEINNPNNQILLNARTLDESWKEAGVLLDRVYADNPDGLLAGIAYSEMRTTIPVLISDIAESSIRIRSIVDNLKDFARPGELRAVAAVDVNNAVNRAIRLVKYQIDRKTRNFHLDLAPGLPEIQGNSQNLEQVIINLVLNALQALPDRDAAVSVYTDIDRVNHCVSIAVKDQGHGIPESHMERLFDPFFTTRKLQGGTGLGLAISDALIREHHGKLVFQSNPGEGTRATILLPYTNDSTASSEPGITPAA